jgi:hypothetical protein
MSILILDGANLLHRARSGFQLGDYHVIYNFVRQLRSLVEQHRPTRVYLTLEGAPKRQLALFPEYKANRAIDPTSPDADKKLQSLASFRRQRDLAVDMLQRFFPVSVVWHPDFEGDDCVYNLVKRSSTTAEFTIVSTDSDFQQMTQEFTNVRLYNPVTKAYIEAPEHDYVIWKALRGDPSDNVPALINEADALRFAGDLDALNASYLSTSPEFSRNLALIDLHGWSDEEALGMRSSSPTRDWESVRQLFVAWSFNSLLKEATWAKLVTTFDTLWGTSQT